MEPIAIIGLGCRFPKAGSPEEFWQVLHEGVDCITHVPAGRWKHVNFDDYPALRGRDSLWQGAPGSNRPLRPAFLSTSRHGKPGPGPAADRVVQVLGDRPGQRDAVVGAGAAADLVEDDQAARAWRC